MGYEIRRNNQELPAPAVKNNGKID